MTSKIDNRNNEEDFNQYRIDCKNKNGEKIAEIFARSKGLYTIYKCEGEKSIYLDGSRQAEENYSEIIPLISKIFSNGKVIEVDDSYLESQIVFSIKESSVGNIDKAKDILIELDKKINKLKNRSRRLIYLSGVFTVFIVFSLLSLWCRVNGMYALDILTESIVFLIYVSTAGCIGGFLSVSLKVNKLDIDADSGFAMNFLPGMERGIVAIMCSIFSYFAIKSNLVMGITQELPSKYFIIVFAIISGFSETFVPNIISKIDNENT